MLPGKQGFPLPDWNHVCGPPTASARIRVEPRDFEVVEIPGFELTGNGEHDYLYVQKTDANTPWVARGLANYAGVAVRDVGFAGMKDRHAVTRQWFSVRRPGGVKADWNAMELQGVTLLDVSRHNRKLRRGTHLGNRFRLRLREFSDPDSNIAARLQTIREQSVPNYFGEQRFGRNGQNLLMAASLFAGQRLPRAQRSIAISAARSLLFNDVLSARVSAGSWSTLCEGDVASLAGSGSIFPVGELTAELIQRCNEFDIHPSGVLWGKGAPSAISGAGELERAIAGNHTVLTAGLERCADEGRRPLRLVVDDFDWDIGKEKLNLNFFLPRGGFATSVLRELVTYPL